MKAVLLVSLLFVTCTCLQQRLIVEAVAQNNASSPRVLEDSYESGGCGSWYYTSGVSLYTYSSSAQPYCTLVEADPSCSDYSSFDYDYSYYSSRS